MKFSYKVGRFERQNLINWYENLKTALFHLFTHKTYKWSGCTVEIVTLQQNLCEVSERIEQFGIQKRILEIRIYITNTLDSLIYLNLLKLMEICNPFSVRWLPLPLPTIWFVWIPMYIYSIGVTSLMYSYACSHIL